MKPRNILFSCIIFLTLSQKLSAQTKEDWIWLGTATDGAEYYQKNNFTTKYYSQASSILVWQKIEYKDKIKIVKGKKFIKRGGSRISLIEYFCQDGTYRAVQSTEYNHSGESIGSFEEEFGELKHAIPESMGELGLKSACAMKKD